MSRSGYTEDGDFMELYRSNVERTLAGRRGQKFLQELADFMDAMPEKKLIAGVLVNSQGECCTLGVVCKARQLDVSKLDYEDPKAVSGALGISGMMAAEIAFMNDDWPEWRDLLETDEARWVRMRKWVDVHLKTPKDEGSK